MKRRKSAGAEIKEEVRKSETDIVSREREREWL